MANWITVAKPHANKLMILAGIVVGVLLVTTIWSSQKASSERAGWDAYIQALNAGDMELSGLQNVAEEHANTVVHEWAYATWADRQLLLASRGYLIDRDAALERLEKVRGYYDTLVDSQDPQIRGRAHLGLGRIYEMQDKLDEARDQYNQVQGDWAPLAQDRLKQLVSDEAQAACEWLATTELPKPASSTGPGTPGERPDFEASVPPTSSDQSGGGLKTLEELLGTSGSIINFDDNRYGEQSDDAESDDAESEPEADASEQPPADAADEPAPTE